MSQNLFFTRDIYEEKIDSTHILVTNSEYMFIPIGKFIQHIFQDMKPADFDHFLKLYKFIISNILWIIKPAKDEKKEIMLGNLCGMQYVWCSST